MFSWTLRRLAGFAAVSGLLFAFATDAAADTRIMPNRQAQRAVDVVVWGNTTLANGTAFTLACGNGTQTAGTVADRTYISRTCNYATAGVFTATLTVGAETATAQVEVVDAAAGTFELRALRINMAIEDGLRYLYFSQAQRTTRFDTNLTSWVPNGETNPNNDSSPHNAFTALAVLAIQNHGHPVNAPATDIFQPVVQRGLNWLFDALIQRSLGSCAEPAGNPCVNVPAPVATGLSGPTNDGDDGYATPIFLAAIAAAAGSQPARIVAAGLGSNNSNFVAGRTYAEILQRVTNAVVWGQSDSGAGRGGWYYNLQAGSLSDGSTMGWGLLGLIDAAAAGATVPAFAKTEFAVVLANQRNNNGSLDYQVDSSPTTTSSNMAKTGIGIQGLAFTGVAQNDPRMTAALGYVVRNWTSQVDPADFQCDGGTPSQHNKGCGYAMFNIFKGLRLYGINTLPGINRPAGPGSIQADDWYADYVDNLLANQHLPSNPSRGEWSRYDDVFNTTAPTMGWSCCHYATTGVTALALLILSPVAFVPPDPILFSTVGLSPASATLAVGGSHTVTALAQSSNNQPVPGAVVDFKVISGPNTGKIGQGTTNASGQTSFTYSDTGGAGTDTIQAFIGALASNQVTAIWQTAAIPRCDANGDNTVNNADLTMIAAANGQLASSGTDPRDGNGDGRINVLDMRYCQLRFGPVNPN